MVAAELFTSVGDGSAGFSNKGGAAGIAGERGTGSSGTIVDRRALWPMMLPALELLLIRC
jgi:hypothetical protein